jgi:peptidoglycan/LPS O-acetylase OafA/YrhL
MFSYPAKFRLKSIHYTSKAHLPQLDGIRGLAIILVLLNHLYTFVPLAIIGWIGVDLFFVLSGFLITGILIDSRNKSGYYFIFLRRRILRIFPLYYFFLVLFFIIYPLSNIHYIPNYKNLFSNQFWFWTYIQNLFFAFNGWPSNQMLDHFWSLAVEEQFYLFWPLIILNCSSKTVIKISVLLIISSVIVRNIIHDDPFAVVFTVCRLDSLSIGALCAIFIREYKKFLENHILKVAFFTSIILIAICLYTSNLRTTNIYFVRLGFTLFDIFFASVIILSFDGQIFKGFIKSFFSTTFLKFFGKYSYGIYVFHLPLYYLFYLNLVNLFRNFLSSEFLINFSASISLTIIICVVSIISYYMLERPFLLLKDSAKTISVS